MVEAWRQLKAGLALIVWSRLASWDPQNLSLVAADETDFESSAGHQDIHAEYGRLICWIAFSVGAEYLTKGVCMLKGRDLSQNIKSIQLPERDEGIEEWIRLVNEDRPSVQKAEVGTGTLGGVPGHVRKILTGGPERDLVVASIDLLASAIRNRDAHRYTLNVRAFHFYLVPRLFVPSFNILLASLDRDELRHRSSELRTSAHDNT